MKVLAFDTTAASLSVALYDAAADRFLAEMSEPLERGHAERLFGVIGDLVQQSGLSLKSIDLFAVTTGPGNFTGVRIGLAAARGFALAARRPIVGVNSLEVLAGSAEAPPSAAVVAAIDARRGEIYAQAFWQATAKTEPFAAPAEAAAQSVIAVLGEAPIAVIGNGAEPLVEALKSAGARANRAPGALYPHAATLARLAASKPHAATARPGPVYLRAPDAKTPRAAWS